MTSCGGVTAGLTPGLAYPPFEDLTDGFFLKEYFKAYKLLL